jgi:hypothetical protein
MATKKRPSSDVSKSQSLVGSDLYLERWAGDGSMTITEHRVWDGVRFFDSELKRAQAEGGIVKLSSKAAYMEARK